MTIICIYIYNVYKKKKKRVYHKICWEIDSNYHWNLQEYKERNEKYNKINKKKGKKKTLNR